MQTVPLELCCWGSRPSQLRDSGLLLQHLFWNIHQLWRPGTHFPHFSVSVGNFSSFSRAQVLRVAWRGFSGSSSRLPSTRVGSARVSVPFLVLSQGNKHNSVSSSRSLSGWSFDNFELFIVLTVVSSECSCIELSGRLFK